MNEVARSRHYKQLLCGVDTNVRLPPGTQPPSLEEPFSYTCPICFSLRDDALLSRDAHSGRGRSVGRAASEPGAGGFELHGDCEHWDHSRGAYPETGPVNLPFTAAVLHWRSTSKDG